jgi:uncharacterized phage protein (TIGR01671 family)
MDKIKYRAWDKKNKEMLYDVQNLYDGNIEHKGRWTIQSRSFGELLTEPIDCCDPNSELRFVVLPFTGLLDKNKKEIYEDDILATSNDGKDGCDKWDKKDFGYTKVIWSNKNSCFSGSNWTWDVNNDESVYDLHYCEIIGDIYSNPELLK